MNGRNTVEQHPAEQELAEILAAVLSTHLGDQPIGPDDDFYAMGGDSLIALRVVTDVQQQGIPMTLRDLLFHPTVRELSAHLAASGPQQAAPAAPVGERFELLDPSDRGLVPHGVREALPASALQVGIIYLCETSGDPELYHSVIGWETLARFDETLFREALAELCDRHAALRTSFDLGTYSEAVQLQWADVELPLTVEELPTADPAKAQSLVQEWNRHGLRLPIDWSTAPLFRCHVVAQPDSFHVVLASHHAILDGWSYGRLIVDLLALYDAKLRGRAAALPALPGAGEAEFIEAERRLLASATAAEYWQRQADAPALLFDRGQFSGAANACESVEFALAPDTVDGLRAAARRAGVSLKSLALAAHVRALADWTGRDRDLVTGVVVNTRTEKPGSDLTVGLYLNTVPMRFDSPRSGAAELARAAHAAERDASQYRGYPLAEIESRLGRAPFDVVFNYMNFHVYQDLEELEGLKTRAWWTRGKPSFPFRVDFELDGAEQGSRVVATYDPALLSEQRTAAFARCYETALIEATGLSGAGLAGAAGLAG
ncbi:condensation domain-containing protein [Kitasatospora sp. NPDC051984]|uniref:condensation domain-containing protein n=1 Tax=Kitasatospora sp. NPDC051984 TaxID=3364059 RepID=UPI0037C9D3BD